MKMKRLPVGIQTFKSIIQDDYIYIDKTDIALDLIQNYTYAFLSRPRRFGKSLFMDTLQNIFEGEKELFKGLYIYDKWDWSIKYPVIKISWGGVTNKEELVKVIFSNLRDNQKSLKLDCLSADDYAVFFKDIIRVASEKYNQKVVILIDEYDKPILDVIDDVNRAKEHREIIKRLYSEIKNQDQYIRFAFLTGVSKFSKASIFSGLNMLTDISLNPRFGDVCGFTHEDLLTKFDDYFVDTDMEKVRQWYNGYNFLKNRLYNPFDILQFLANDKVFDNYWFSTGTPTFLLKLIQKNNYFLPKLSNLTVGKQLLDSFDVENIDLEVILYQSGYLTIDKVVEKPRGGLGYKLKVPNKEVRQSLNDFIISRLFSDSYSTTSKVQDDMYEALVNGDIEVFEKSLISLFAAIPYNNYTKNDLAKYEGFYASVIFAYFQSLGIDIIGEDVTNLGRIDLVLKMDKGIYIIEFKVDGKSALDRIKEKRYHEKYLTENKPIYLIGIEFDSTKKNVEKIEWEKVV